jgi:hypothetical protein
VEGIGDLFVGRAGRDEAGDGGFGGREVVAGRGDAAADPGELALCSVRPDPCPGRVEGDDGLLQGRAGQGLAVGRTGTLPIRRSLRACAVLAPTGSEFFD